MNNSFPSKETVDRLRAQYPPGCRVELVSMSDPYSKLKLGDQGRRPSRMISVRPTAQTGSNACKTL